MTSSQASTLPRPTVQDVADILLPSFELCRRADLLSSAVAGTGVAMPSGLEIDARQLTDPMIQTHLRVWTAGASTERPDPLVATTWQGTEGLKVDRPDLEYLAWELQDSRQSLEMLLPILGWGKELAALGVNLLIGPSLAVDEASGKSVYGRHRDAALAAIPIFIEAMNAAGIQPVATGFQAQALKDSLFDGDGMLFTAAMSKGMLCVLAEPEASSQNDGEAGDWERALRGDADFRGAVLSPEAPSNEGEQSSEGKPVARIVDLLTQGYDLIRVDELAEDGWNSFLERILKAVQDAGLSARLKQSAARNLALRDRS